MNRFKNRTLFSSFKYALIGLITAAKTQRNFRIGFVLALATLFSTILLKFSAMEFALVVVAISFVVFAEMVNTTIEYVVDTYFGDNHSEIAKKTKDIAAGTVLLAIFNAAVIGLLMFFPKIAPHIDTLLLKFNL